MTAPVASMTVSGTSGMMAYTVQFTDTSTNTPTYVLINFGDGQTRVVNPEGSAVDHAYNRPGTYHPYIYAQNADGSSTYYYPVPIVVSPPTFDLCLQIDGHDMRDSYLVGSLRINQKLGAKGSASFSLFDPEYTPEFGFEVGIWDGDRVDEARKHGAVVLTSTSNIVSSQGFAFTAAGTIRIVFKPASATIKQGLYYYGDGVKAWIDTDSKLYVQFMTSNLPSSGLIATGVTVSTSTTYDMTVRWSSTTGLWDVRVNGASTNSGSGATFTATAAALYGVGQLGKTTTSVNQFRGTLVAFESLRIYVDDVTLERMESWIPYPWNDANCVGSFDFREAFRTAFAAAANYSAPPAYATSTARGHRLNLTNYSWTTVDVVMARKLFGGRVLTNKKSDHNIYGHYWNEVSCDDFSSIFDRNLVYGATNYGSATILEYFLYTAFQAQTGEEVTINSVDQTQAALLTTLSGRSYTDATLATMITDVLKFASLSWYVDAYRDIHFYDMATTSSPLNINYSTNNYSNFTLTKSGPNYVNHIYLKTGTLTTTFADGTYDDIVIQRGTDYIHGYISNEIIGRSDTDHGNGQYMLVETDTTIVDENVAFAKLKADLGKFAPAKVATFDTLVSDVEVGQVMTINLPSWSISAESYLITSITISDSGGILFKRSVTATYGTYQFQWRDWFKNLGK